MPCIVSTERYVFAFGFAAVVPQLVSLQVSPTVVATISKLQLQTENREGGGEWGGGRERQTETERETE